jgi:hypothetical protein
MFILVKKFYLSRVKQYKYGLHRVRKHYTVLGPKFLWSNDSYLKFVNYGIEIYAGIDAYFCYITWIYCGILVKWQSQLSNNILKNYK